MYNFKDAQIAGAKALKETEEMDAGLSMLPDARATQQEEEQYDVDRLPAWQDGRQFLMSSNDVKNRKILIGGRDKESLEDGAILRERCKLVVGGASKAGKSWILLDLALAVAAALDCIVDLGLDAGQRRPDRNIRRSQLGHFNCKEGRVLFVNLELHPDTMGKRGGWIGEARRYVEGNDSDRRFKDEEHSKNMCVWNLRGKCYEIETMLETARMRKSDGDKGFSLIILDPIYKTYGDRDENSASDMANLFALVEDFAAESNAAIAFAAHYSKGNQAEKSAADRISGSGVFARDPDAILSFTPHEIENHHTLSASLREFAPIPEQVFAWEAPIMSPAYGVDPSKLRDAGDKNGAWREKAKAIVEAINSSPRRRENESALPVREAIAIAIAKVTSAETVGMWEAALSQKANNVEAEFKIWRGSDWDPSRQTRVPTYRIDPRPSPRPI